MILRHFLFVLSCVPIFLTETRGSNIRGIPGVSYPNFSEIPPTSFRCPLSEPKGFYPDFETRCQVFHYCDEDGNQETFICRIGSIFNPRINSCDRWFNYDCKESLKFDTESSYDDGKADYEVPSDGDVVGSLLESGSNLFDKMASLFEESSSGAYGQYENENGQGRNPDVYSEYGGSSQNEVDRMGENEESRREVSEISRGNSHLDLRQNVGFENSVPLINLEGWDSVASEVGAGLQSNGKGHSQQEINREGSENGHLSASMHVDDEYAGVDSPSDYNNDESSKGLGVMYYRNPTAYNYNTGLNDYNGEQEGDSVYYGGEMNSDSYSSEYGSDMEYNNYEEIVFDSDQNMDLQKRISEYRRRPRPKPVVSFAESDLEIVTLPPQRPKRPRMPLVQKNPEQSVTEPMTTTTEFSAEVQRKSEATESSRGAVAAESAPDDELSGDGEGQMLSGFQQERSGGESDFEDWLTEDAGSGDAEDFLQSEDFDESLELNQSEVESEGTDTNIRQLHDMMRPNLFYVDSNTDYSVSEKTSNSDASEGKYEENHGYDYKNEGSDVDYRVNTGENVHVGNFNSEIEDSSEAMMSDQHGDSYSYENYQYENRNEEAEDFGELFQTVIDGEVKSLIRLGEDIIDPTQYFPEWKDDSSTKLYEESSSDVVSKRSEEYAEDNSKETNAEESQDVNSFDIDQMMQTSSDDTEGYYSDYQGDYSYQYGDFSSDSAPDSTGSFSEEVTFIPSLEDSFPTTQAYDMLNDDGVDEYQDFSDADLMENYYSGEYGGNSEDNEEIVMSSADDAASPSDDIYYYTTEMGSQFVTDQPDMEMATTAMIDEEYSPNAGISEDYSYDASQSDDSFSNADFEEGYFTTDSTISDKDVQFVTDRPDFGISSTAISDGEYYSNIEGESDGEFQEQHFQTDSYDSDAMNRFVTVQPDFEMSSTALSDGEEHSEDARNHGELTSDLETSHSEGLDVDEEFQEYLKAESDLLKAEFSNERENHTSDDKVERSSEASNQDEEESESDESTDTTSSVHNTTPDTSKEMGSNFITSTSSKKHHTVSETSQKSHSKESFSIDSSSDPIIADFDFDSTGDALASFEEESSTNEESSSEESSTSDDANIKSQPPCSTCPKKRNRSFSSNEFMGIGESSFLDQPGKLLEGSKLAKLAAIVKKFIAAKKKAKLNIVNKILPSSEWNAGT